MSGPRFQVATCEGFSIRGDGTRRRSGNAPPGISATVCDTLYLWREIKTYRSDEKVPLMRAGGWRGRAGALQDAQDHAAYLNALYGGE